VARRGIVRVVVRVAPRLLVDALARTIRGPGTEVVVATDAGPEEPADVAIVGPGQVDAVDAEAVIELKNPRADGEMAVLHSSNGRRTRVTSHRELRAVVERLAGGSSSHRDGRQT
jgi:hypothetical protein